MRLKFLILVLVGQVLFGCTEEVTTPRPYPRVRTYTINDNTTSGVTFKGGITYASTEIIDHGFIWSTNYLMTIENSEKVSLGPKSEIGGFKVLVDRAMQKGVAYYVRAYAKSKQHLVYGELGQFTSMGGIAPSISSFEPKQGHWGDTITISGTRFSNINTVNLVKVGTIPATVASSTDNTIKFIVPPKQVGGFFKINLEVIGEQASSTEDFELVITPPAIFDISPDSVWTGKTVVISGEHFNSNFTEVEINDFLIQDKIVATKSITFTIPKELPFGALVTKVRVLNNEAISQKVVYKVLPKLIEISPASANYEDVVSIQGKFFPTNQNLKVYFDDWEATIVSVTNNTLKVSVPFFYSRPDPQISVAIEGQKVSIDGFNILPPRIDSIDPRTNLVLGDIITVSGENLDAAELSVRLGNQDLHYDVIRWSKNSLLIRIPDVNENQAILSVERFGEVVSYPEPLTFN